MNLSERRTTLVNRINGIKDEQTLEMLEETLAYFTHHNDRDITDGLDNYQIRELSSLFEEPAEKDTISEDEFKKLFARWRAK